MLTKEEPCVEAAGAVKLRVLVVDDSSVMRRMLTRMLAEDPEIDVVGAAKDGLDALVKVAELHPQVVTLDIEMPELDGMAALHLIRARHPDVRVIMVSSRTERGALITIDALMGGASDYITKPDSGDLSPLVADRLAMELRLKVKQLFRPYARRSIGNAPKAADAVPAASPALEVRRLIPEIFAIGVSTGGPLALADILPTIPADFPVPIVIVQHMPPTFTRMLAERLAKLSKIAVVEAEDGMRLRPGCAFLAPGNFHMRLMKRLDRVEILLNQDVPENSCRPAVDVLFRSVADIYGDTAIAAVLTGMGRDGLLGARALKERGSIVLVQDKATSVVWGMPGAIVDAHLADMVLPLDKIIPEVMSRLWPR